MSEPARSELIGMIADLKDWLRAYAMHPACVDVAFIGNTSGHYPSTPGLMVDFDAFVFVAEMNSAAGQPIAALRERWTDACHARAIDFELRIVEGPYKPPLAILRRPVLVVHLGVFTESLYLAAAPLKRWAWRKYICEREPGRLARMAPPRPTLAEFITGPKGLRERCEAIEAGAVEMTEWLLPDLQARSFVITLDEANFVECCFAYAANTARNHARTLGMGEADQLPNSEFFSWYDQTVLRSPELVDLMNHKAACRDQGFVVEIAHARRLALRYMRALERHLAQIS
ncbi:hypothetical protein [Bradyrhizobium sp. CCGB01]|uniref:hypothetical protein n=1 Tax=Bradyrhizobium sp. CCGB01 TaxID=2949634 RepID=UPI0020B3F87F|nr:hypothetical protein [Bradyrhizobium sp. CCGB01]MCP3404741.1 hypothetical protein [Bradyrhizobium sp. CCGB01]